MEATEGNAGRDVASDSSLRARMSTAIRAVVVPSRYPGSVRRSVGQMISRLAERQMLVLPWSGSRSGGGDAAQVASDLRMLLFAEGDADDGAYERLENQVEAQGHLFECAPGVVSVIAAAVADGTIPPANLAPTLDLLGRIVAVVARYRLVLPDTGRHCRGRRRQGGARHVAGVFPGWNRTAYRLGCT